MALISTLFAIKICHRVVMHNHYHIVLKLNPELTKTWSLSALAVLPQRTVLNFEISKDDVIGKVKMRVLIKTIEDWRAWRMTATAASEMDASSHNYYSPCKLYRPQ